MRERRREIAREREREIERDTEEEKEVTGEIRNIIHFMKCAAHDVQHVYVFMSFSCAPFIPRILVVRPEYIR